MSCLAGLADLRRHLDIQPDAGDDDLRLFAALQAASHAIETFCARRFVPYLQTCVQPVSRAATEITLETDLLQLISIADESGVIPLNAVETLPALASASALRRIDGGAFTGNLTMQGWWGWHDSPDSLWISANDTVRSDPLDFDLTVLEVVSVEGEDARGHAPRFQAGYLIRIGDELMTVIKADSDTHLLSLVRGAGGTQPVTHLRGAQIRIYQPPRAIRDLALRYAAWLLQHPEPPPEILIAALLPFRRFHVK
ncbi:MAG: hypothetical protein UZ15_CFX003003015 [Chloroflexi bacterium OLB15]|nr:MAG: hypothetical protein UZ15_CFX003003015 [Chloroflexi bacterium OLB15]